jgi:hypothetical protein
MLLTASSYNNILLYVYINKIRYEKANLLLSRELDND